MSDTPAPTPAAAVAALTTEELLRRRGELAYAAQMAALEGLTLDAQTAAESQQVEAELTRRNAWG